MKKKQTIAVGAAVAAFSGAFVTVFFKSRDPLPAIPPDARPILCLCTKCSHHFEMPYVEYATAIGQGASSDEGGGRVSADSGAEDGSKSRAGGLVCPSCDAASVVAANHCETHDTYYPSRRADGSLGRCMQCPIPS